MRCAVPLFLAAAWSLRAQAQCDPTVPVLAVDLSASPSATWQSPTIQRQGLCCGNGGSDRCLEFVITLHPDAQGIVFNICSGAVPPGAMFYQIGCGPPTAVGAPVCLSGAGPHVLTFCKPGGNSNSYCITSIAAPSAGPSIAVNDGCSGTITSNGFAPGTVLWTSVAPGVPGQYNGYLACPTCANTGVTAQAGYPAFVDYQVCGNAVSPCSSMIFCDTVRVWFNSTLAATIQPLQPTVCFGAAGTTITAVGAGGTPPYTYLWNTGETTASIFVGPGNYTVQLGDTSRCPPTSASVVVTQFQQVIEALAGPDILVCGQGASGAVTLNGAVTGASGGLWSGGAGTFTPGPGTLNATYTPTPAEIAAGSVQLTLTTTGNGTCPGDTDDLTITFAAPFTIVALIATDAHCANTSDGTATVSPAIPGWTYAWAHDPGLSGPTASGLPAGTYNVTITAPSGCDTLLSTVVNAPLPIAIADLAVTHEQCAGNNDGAITVTANGGTAPYHYAWNTGHPADTLATLSAGAGTYTVTVTDANGCAAAQGSATINALGQPNQANAGADLIGCFGSLPVALSGAVTNATGGTWSGGTGSFTGAGLNVTYMPTMAEVNSGGVDLFLTTTGNTTCPADRDTVHVTLPSSFFHSSITATPVACAGDPTGTATFLPNGPGFSFLWNDPAAQTANTATGLHSGTYAVHVTDAFGCDTTASVFIPEPLPLTITGIATQHPTCAGYANGSATVMVTGGTPSYTYAWSANTGGQVTPTASGLPSGAYLVTVTDANHCTTQAGTTLSAPTMVTLAAQAPDTVCVNAPVQLTAQAGGGQGGYVITWTGIGTGDTLVYSFPASQVVTVTVSDAIGCPGPMLTLPIAVLDLTTATLHTYGDTTVCPGGTAQVGAWLSGYPGGYSMAWPQLGTSGPGPFTVPVTSSNTLDVVVTNTCGQTLSAPVVLQLETPPTIVLPALLGEGCAPLSVTFPDLGLPGPLQYHWNLGNGQTSTSPMPTVTYGAGQYSITLSVSTPAGCTSSAATPAAVIVHAPPIADFTADPWITDIDHGHIVFTDQSQGDLVDWAWDLGDGSTYTIPDPEHTYTDLGIFPVELWVMDVNGCTDTIVQPVVIKPVHDITVPNIFTPGGPTGGYWIPGDLSNDTFYPFVRFVKDFRMRIFNRWGELVFESFDVAQGWDGWYRSAISAQDVYVYQIWVRFVDNYERTLMGDVTLMR